MESLAGAAATCDETRLAAPAAALPLAAVPKSRRRFWSIASVLVLVSILVVASSCASICKLDSVACVQTVPTQHSSCLKLVCPSGAEQLSSCYSGTSLTVLSVGREKGT